jgi:large conductance mechanosensitive channel
MLKGFRDFILRGNVVDLAVAVIIGGAFNAIVASLVKDVLGGFIAAAVGKPDFSALAWDIHGGHIAYGNFLTAIVNFLLVAAVIYFFVVTPLNKIAAHAKKLQPPPPPPAPKTKVCPECLSEIPLAARRCAHCGQLVDGPEIAAVPDKALI